MKTNSYTVYSTLQNNIISGAFVGQNILTCKEIRSTNDLMKQMVANSTPLAEGTVIMAEHQTAGKGQQQNVWFTEAGKNLTFSVLLCPDFMIPDQAFNLLAAISLGVTKSLQRFLGSKIQIKWPNDIYYGEKKLGGILIENTIANKSIKNAVVGVGININQEKFPAHLPNAVSIWQIIQKESSIKEVLLEICAGIEFYYLKLKRGEVIDIKNEYLDNLFGLNKKLLFETNNSIFEGEINTVNHLGHLGIKVENETKFFDLKQVKFIFK